MIYVVVFGAYLIYLASILPLKRAGRQISHESSLSQD